MQNHDNNNFKMLIKEACRVLSVSYQELRDTYKDFPMCLMEYMERGIREPVIEVRLDTEKATLSLSFNKENICEASYLFFDNLKDEDRFIEYLNKCTPYDFKGSSWVMPDCYLQAKPSKYETAFCFYT